MDESHRGQNKWGFIRWKARGLGKEGNQDSKEDGKKEEGKS